MTDWTIHQGCVLNVLPTLEAGSVHCCVTSPPYWGLRDYGTADWEGGDPGCDHIKSKSLKRDCSGGVGGGRDKGTRGEQPSSSSPTIQYRAACGKCGATRRDSQLGLEPTPELFLERMVQVFREVRRVLRDDGTLWLNMGDSYAGYWGDKKAREEGRPSSADTNGWTNGFNMNARPQFDNLRQSGLKPKDLCGIPWRLALALQADGWYLRADIIWAKPNPMPESVTDRPTKAHEYVFLLTKQGRYYYDAEAVREESTKSLNATCGSKIYRDGKRMRNGINGTLGPGNPAGRNSRSVWNIPTQSFPEAHFATFPEELPRRCIAAGCPEGGTVLDPFAGSGTTVAVAARMGRRGVGIELNPEYVALAEKRIRQATRPATSRSDEVVEGLFA